jgi:hypothetical protein
MQLLQIRVQSSLPGQFEGGKSIKLVVSMRSYHLMMRLFAPVASPLERRGNQGPSGIGL